jgi:hypothetical protein
VVHVGLQAAGSVDPAYAAAADAVLVSPEGRGAAATGEAWAVGARWEMGWGADAAAGTNATAFQRPAAHHFGVVTDAATGAPMGLADGARAPGAPPPPPSPPPPAAAAAAAALKAEVAALVLGSLGAASLLTQWPLFFIAHAAGWERWAWPPPPAKARMIALNMGLDSVYNLALLWGISTTSAFAMQLASTLVVPAGILADWVAHGALPSAMAACGAAVVCGAVAALDCAGCKGAREWARAAAGGRRPPAAL